MFCLLTGMIAAVGACVVANFQETSDITMHMLGAMLCFGVGSTYFIVHVSISLRIMHNRRCFNTSCRSCFRQSSVSLSVDTRSLLI